MKRSVVITGIGAVTPIGLDADALSKNLRAGTSGLKAIPNPDAKPFPVDKAFCVTDFNARKYRVHLLDPFIQYAVAATAEALTKADLDLDAVDPYRVGISVSSSKGGMSTIDRFKERFEKHRSAILGARIYTNSVPNFAAQWIARRWKVKGPAKCYIAACATGTTAVIEGVRMVEEGVVDYCIAGASDASIVPLMLAGYHNMKALASDNMYPFDQRRNGFMVGEGAGIVLLETLESALARKARIYGQIAGYGYGTDNFHPLHFDAHGDALCRTIQETIRRSEMQSAEELDYVNLHGTATREGDLYETLQIKKAFGPQAAQLSMSATKAMTGHMLGASGAVEIIICLLAMQEGFVPPTLHLDSPDPTCDLNYTPKTAVEKNVSSALTLSMGFGGHVAALALRKT